MSLAVCMAITAAVCIAVYIAAVAYAYRMAFSRHFVFSSKKKNESDGRDQSQREQRRLERQRWLEEQRPEHLYITNGDGKRLHALYLPGADQKKMAIAVHGWRSNCSELAGQARVLRERGYAVILPDLCAHGGSEGEHIGFGWEDRKDILLWIEQARSLGAGVIGLIGVSMGAAAVMMTLGEALPPQVRWAIEDCGYSAVDRQIRHSAKKMFGHAGFMADAIISGGSLWNRLRRGYFFKDASAVEQLKKSTLPMLFIHGTQDRFVPYSMLQDLVDAHGGEKSVLRVARAKHAECFSRDREAYTRAMTELIQKAENTVMQ